MKLRDLSQRVDGLLGDLASTLIANGDVGRALALLEGVAVAWSVGGGPGRVSVVKVGIVNQMVDIGEHGA